MTDADQSAATHAAEDRLKRVDRFIRIVSVAALAIITASSVAALVVLLLFIRSEKQEDRERAAEVASYIDAIEDRIDALLDARAIEHECLYEQGAEHRNGTNADSKANADHHGFIDPPSAPVPNVPEEFARACEQFQTPSSPPAVDPPAPPIPPEGRTP